MLLLEDLQRLAPEFRAMDLDSYLRNEKSAFKDRFILLYRLMLVLVGINQKNLALSAAASRPFRHVLDVFVS